MMLMVALALGVNAAYAQSETFRAFKVEFSSGLSWATGKGGGGDVVLAMEPKYAINDKLTFGLRMELAGRTYTGKDRLGEEEFSGSYMATGDYYFNTNGLRPFAGFGVGVMGVSALGETDGFIELEEKDVLAFMPRVGFETGHFRMGLEYNIPTKSYGYNSNYAALKIGFFVGGGRR
jgi:hypothetical protein